MGFFFVSLGPRYAPASAGQPIFGGLESAYNAGGMQANLKKIAKNGSDLGGCSEESLSSLVGMVLTLSLGTKGHRQDTH